MSSDTTTTNPSTPARQKNSIYPSDHAALTPPNAAEQFFLPELKTSDISAVALAAAVRNNSSKHSSSQSIKSSAAAESVYVSCQGDLSESSQQLNSDEEDVLLGNNRGDADESTGDEPTPQDSNSRFKFSLFPMQRKKKQSKKKNIGVKGGPSLKASSGTATPSEVTIETPFVETPIVTPTSLKGSEGPAVDDQPFDETTRVDVKDDFPTEVELDQAVTIDDDNVEEVEQVVIDTEGSPPQGQHFDVGSHLYEQVKGMWMFGKSHVPVVGFFLAAAESAADKVLGYGKLQDVDTNIIQPVLSGFDRVYLDPFISKVLEVVTPFVHRLETAVIKAPIVPKLLHHIGIRVGDHEEKFLDSCEEKDEAT